MLNKIGELPVDQVRHAAFVNEARLLVITAQADVWEVDVPDLLNPRLLCPGREILASVSKALRLDCATPASGGYPRVAASARGDSIVVNTHDCILVECDPAGKRSPRLVTAVWGIYYPDQGYSSDGSLYFVNVDGQLLVYSTDDWDGHRHTGCVDDAGWHPQQPRLLCLDDQEQLSWLSFERSARDICTTPVGRVCNDNDEWRSPTGLVVGARTCVVSYQTGHLVWFRLDPFRPIANETIVGTVYDELFGAGGQWFGVVSESGMALWNMESQEHLCVDSVEEVVFSPSSRYMVGFGRTPSNPSPKVGGGFPGHPAVLWELLLG